MRRNYSKFNELLMQNEMIIKKYQCEPKIRVIRAIRG